MIYTLAQLNSVIVFLQFCECINFLNSTLTHFTFINPSYGYLFNLITVLLDDISYLKECFFWNHFICSFELIIKIIIHCVVFFLIRELMLIIFHSWVSTLSIHVAKLSAIHGVLIHNNYCFHRKWTKIRFKLYLFETLVELF